jgi:diguanylate cyclase (GGDEF)-like protein
MIAIIADDEDTNRLLLANAVRAVGLTPLEFEDGLAALQAATANAVSLVLLDVDMPAMDGFEVCRRLRHLAAFDTVPIVMVTANEEAAAVAAAFAAGATDFIAKPVNWALLPRRLEYVLRNAAQVRALADREVEVRTLVEALPDQLWVVAADGTPRWRPQRSVGPPDGEGPVGLAPAQYRAAITSAILQTGMDGASRALDYQENSDSGEARSYMMRFTRREGGDVVVIRQDTSERTAASARINRLAYYDALTGLPNRQSCLEAAERLIADARARQEAMAVVYLDLNGFKRINDTFGHGVGDAVLSLVAGKLRATTEEHRPPDGELYLTRFGGDEFVILLRHAQAHALAVGIANACVAALGSPVTHVGLELYATPSIGVAGFPDDGDSVETIVSHADTAMYQAKKAAANAVAVYSHAMSSRLRDSLDLEARLRRAVRESELSLHFQPKFRIADRRVAGVEALVRWTDAEHGSIPPSQFIAIAEESGLIIDLGAWVTRTACRQVRAWLDAGIRWPVAINVSAKELLYGSPAEVVEREAAAASIPPGLIEVEITESLLVHDSAAVRAALAHFRELGCRIALDDFGTGFSSLAYIARLPPDRIKIDRAFIRNIETSSADAAIAEAVLSLGKGLGLLVTAEGVETGGQLDWLRQRGCHEAQGFWLARPQPAATLVQSLLGPPPPMATASAASTGSLG